MLKEEGRASDLRAQWRADRTLIVLRPTVLEETRRTVADTAIDLRGLEVELEAAAYDDTTAEDARTILAARELVASAANLLGERFGRDHALQVAALEVLCAHCGHDFGEHLVKTPHACEAETDGEGCGCAGFVPPGQFAPAHERETQPAPVDVDVDEDLERGLA